MDEALTRTGQRRRRTASRLRHESGFSLIEVLVAALVLSVGVAATMRVFGASGRTTLRAQAQQVAVQEAQAELERLAGVPYPALALTASAPSSSDPRNP